MKKILVLILCLVLCIFSSCTKEYITNEYNTYQGDTTIVISNTNNKIIKYAYSINFQNEICNDIIINSLDKEFNNLVNKNQYGWAERYYDYDPYGLVEKGIDKFIYEFFIYNKYFNNFKIINIIDNNIYGVINLNFDIYYHNVGTPHNYHYRFDETKKIYIKNQDIPIEINILDLENKAYEYNLDLLCIHYILLSNGIATLEESIKKL